MAGNESVGKISLQLEVMSDLNNQIKQVASSLGDQLKTAISGISNLNFGGLFDNLGKQMTTSIENNLRGMQKVIENNLIKNTEKALANMKRISIPVEFDMPKNFKMPKQNIKVSSAQMRAPPMPKIDTEDVSRRLRLVNIEIDKNEAKLNELKSLYGQPWNHREQYWNSDEIQSQIDRVINRISNLVDISNKLQNKLAASDKQLAMMGNAAKESTVGLSESARSMNMLPNPASRAINAIRNLGSSFRSTDNSCRSAYGGISGFMRNMLEWGIIFPMVAGGIGTLGSYIGSAFMANAQFNDSLNQIKSNLMVAFMPIYQAVLPALNSLMHALATVTAYIASFISQLFGKTYQQSYNSARALQSQIGAMTIAQKQAQKTANSLGGVGKSATDSANSVKKAAATIKGALAGFDEINTLSLENQSATVPKASTPKVTTPAGTGVTTPITPMANMAPIEAATSGWANRFRNILANLWKPFQQAWAAEGQNTINAAKHALTGILDLLGAIARSFYIVWTNGTGERILINLLRILQDILNIIGDIGVTFANAWNKGNIGTQVVQHLANALNNVLSLIDKMLRAIRTVWGQEGPVFAGLFMQALNAVSGAIENVTQKMGWIWDHGGQHAFEGLVKLGLKVGELALFIFTNFVVPFVNWFVNMIAPAIAPVLNVLGYLFDALSKVITWLMGKGKPVLDVIVTVVTSFALAWNGVTIAMKTFYGIEPLLQNAVTGVRTAIGFCTSGIGIWVLAITAAIAIAVLVVQHWDQINKVWQQHKEIIKAVGTIISAILIANLARLGVQAWLTGDSIANQLITKIIGVGVESVITGAKVVALNAKWVAGKAVMLAQTAAIKSVTAAQWLLNAALNANPISIVIIAITALIAGLVLLYNKNKWFHDEVNKMCAAIKNIFVGLWNWLKSFFATWGPVLLVVIAPFLGVPLIIKQHWSQITQFFSSLWSGVKNIFNSFNSWLGSIFSTDWSKRFGWLGDIMNGFLAGIKIIWNAIKQVFSGIINFVAGVFTGNWKRAWLGVKQIFSGIMSGLGAIFKAPLNGVIGLINAAISGLNKIHIDIPDWVPEIGGRKFGVNIAKIPYLAQGGIVDKPTLSMIGEAGKEAVVPLQKNTGGLKILADMLASEIGAEIGLPSKAQNNTSSGNSSSDTTQLGSAQLQIAQVYGQSLNEALAKGLTDTSNVVAKTVNDINTSVTNIMDTLVKSFTTHGTNSDINLSNGINNSSNTVTNSINSVLTKVRNIMNTFANGAVVYGQGIDTALANGINGRASAVTNMLNNLAGRVRSTLSSMDSSCRAYGTGIVTELASGVNASSNKLTSIVKTLTDKVIQQFRSGFGIHSPSRVMYQIGSYLMQGLVNGMSSKNVSDFISKWIGDITGAAGGAANGNVASWLTTAMGITGTPMMFLPMLENIAMHESGGNPKSINLWDSNAKAGHPSKGLMQMIDTTFSAHALPGMNDIWNPIDNAVSAIRYMISQYGGIANVPGIRSQMNGGGYVGYYTGTNSAAKGLAMTGELGPEMIDFSGGEMVLNLKDTIGLINSAVGAISGIKNAIASTIKQPQLAMIGSASTSDQPNKTNFDELKRAIIEAIKEAKGDNGNGGNSADKDINLNLLVQLGDTTFGRAVIKAINKVQKQAGRTLIKI